MMAVEGGGDVWEIHVTCSNVFVKLIGRLDCGCLVSKPWGVMCGCLFFSPAKGACARQRLWGSMDIEANKRMF